MAAYRWWPMPRPERCGHHETNSRAASKRGRIGLGSSRHRPDNPGIAALFLSLAQRAAGPPDDRVPPVQASRRSIRASGPSGRAASDAPARGARAMSARPGSCCPELDRHQQPRSAADRPEHRRHPPRHQAQAAGVDSGRAARPALRCGSCHSPGTGCTSCSMSLKPDDPHHCERPPAKAPTRPRSEPIAPTSSRQASAGSVKLVPCREREVQRFANQREPLARSDSSPGNQPGSYV